MNKNYLIGIILFVSILGGVVIIVLVLALFQQKKINSFKQKNNELQTMIANEQSFLNSSLTVIHVKYVLSSDEACYFKATIRGYEITKRKKLKQNIYYLSQKMQKQYYVEYLAGYLNITTTTENKIINGIIYVTNYRLIFETNSYNLIIWLKNINFVLPSVFNLNGFYQIGFFISTSEKIYCFITNNIRISMTIFKIWQQK